MSYDSSFFSGLLLLIFLRKLVTTGGTEMEFAKSVPSQTDEVFQVYKEATKIMNANNIYQWSENYPGREDIEKDIQSGNLYVLTSEGEIVACVVLDQHQEPEYDHIPWEDSSGRFLVVHRLCVNPNARKRNFTHFAGRNRTICQKRRVCQHPAGYPDDQ